MTNPTLKRIGQIELAVWRYEGHQRGEFQVNIRRRFLSEDGTWRATDATSLDPTMVQGISMTAILWILEAQQGADIASEPDTDPGSQSS